MLDNGIIVFDAIATYCIPTVRATPVDLESIAVRASMISYT